MKKALITRLTIVFILTVAGVSDAAPAKKDAVATSEANPSSVDAAVAVQPTQVQGQISAVGKDYISIVYDHDTAKGIEYEIMVPIEKNMQFKQKKNLKEFNMGDTVEVTFDNLTEMTEDGAKAKRKAKVLTFISPAAAEPSALVSPESGTGP